MNKLTYPFFVLRSHRGFAIFSAIIIALMQYLIVSIMSTQTADSVVGTIMSQMPERFRVLVNENFIARRSVQGAAAFGFNHPLVLALLMINAIVVPTRHIAGEIESGTMEWLLAHPVRRARIVVSLWCTGSLLVLLIVSPALASSLLSMAREGHFTSEFLVKILQVGANLWLLCTLVLSVAMLIATFNNESGKAGIRTASLILALYFLFFLSTIWDFLEWTKPLNIFSYYQPQALMFDERSFLLHAAVLVTLIGICLGTSIWHFRHRDIPG